MKKTIWAVMAVLVIIMSISCGGSPKTSTEAEILADFDPKGFAAAGIKPKKSKWVLKKSQLAIS